MNDKKLSRGKILGYCAGDIFGGGAFTLVGLHFMNFLTDSILLDAAIVGVMLFIGKIWDAIIDPFIGNISENARSSKGKRRIFFLAGIFHILPAFALLWLPIQGAPVWLKAIYFTVAYMLFATSFSLTMVPYHAMLPELTDDNKTRTKLTGLRSIFSNASTLIAGTVPAVLITFGTNIGLGYLFMGLVFGVFYAVPWIIVYFSTRGLDTTAAPMTKEERKALDGPFKSFFKNAKTVLKNRSFRIMLGLYLLSYTAMDIFMAIFIYYVRWYLNMYTSYTLLLGVFMVCQLVSIPVYMKLVNKKGKRFSFILATGLWAFGLALLLVLGTPKTDSSGIVHTIITLIPAVVMALGAGGVAYLPWSMVPEVMDVEELISGKKKDGIYSGFLTFIRQLSQAVAMLIVGLYLDVLDYGVEKLVTGSGPCSSFVDASLKVLPGKGAEYSACIYSHMEPGVQIGIKYFSSFAPMLLLIAALIVSILYPISNKTYIIMKNEIANRNTENPEDIAVLQKIAGKKNKLLRPAKTEEE